MSSRPEVDGLKLETQVLNGKARILLALCDESEKDTKKIKSKHRTRTQLLRTKQAIQELSPTPESYSTTEKTALKPAVNLTAAVAENSANNELITAKTGPANSKQNHGEATLKTGQSGTNLQKPKTTVKKVPTSKQPPGHQKILSEDVTKNLLCLTQEQLQQILSSIGHVKGNSHQNQEEVKEQKVKEKGVEGVVAAEEITEPDCKAAQLNNSSQQPGGPNDCGAGGKNVNPDGSTCKQGENGLFTYFGERENGKELLEARKIQWRKELDEQVAFKKQSQKSLAPEVLVEWNPWGTHDTPMSINTGKMFRPGEATVTAAVPAPSGPPPNGRVINIGNAPMPPEARSGQSHHFSSPDAPAAIRSVFVLGEAVPTEDLFNAVKKEQQQKWLQELDKQREELKARKFQEKLKYAETEDHSRWAMHFDSFQKKPDLHSPVTVGAIRGTVEKPWESYQQNAESEWQQSSVQCASPPNHLSAVGADVCAETHPTATVQKNSFLRSMTALLDPAELDERELRRQKQQEQQKAIALQVEERRRHKQLQEEKKRQEDQKEESRLAVERNKLQQQYEEEKKLLKEKEMQKSRKNDQLYEVIQKAQELAQREKQEQRMRELTRKGHDISNLQKNVEGTPDYVVQSPGRCSALGFVYEEVNEDLADMSGIEQSHTSKQCVQKEHRELAEKVTYSRQVLDHNLVRYTPDIPAEYKMAPDENRTKREWKPTVKVLVTGKENASKQTSGGKRTARAEGKEKLSARPEWNVSKTNKKYIPASKRYPLELQEEREVSKMRRQAELLHLLEKNAPEHRTYKQQCSAEALPDKTSSPEFPGLQAKATAKVSFQAEDKLVRPSQRKEKNEARSKPNHIVPPGRDFRCDSPPVPALKNKLLQVEQRQVSEETNPTHDVGTDHRPPSSKFVPYVRTNEVYHLDPDAPMSRPSSNDPQYRQCKVTDNSQVHSSTAGPERDPLLNPNLVRNRERQQAILKGLSELRQGLMQKRKELETDLPPSVLHQDIPFQHI